MDQPPYVGLQQHPRHDASRTTRAFGIKPAQQLEHRNYSSSGNAGALDQAQSLSLRALTRGQEAWSVMRTQLEILGYDWLKEQATT
jgi:hypothetical protein